MFNFQGISSTRVQSSDIKVLGNSRIKLSQTALDFLGLNPETHRLFIDKDFKTSQIYVAAIAIITEGAKVTSAGLKVNADGCFGNANVHGHLKGQHSEWKISKEGTTFDGVTYYPIEMTLDGDIKRKEDERLAFGAPESTTTVEEVDNTVTDEGTGIVDVQDDTKEEELEEVITPYNV